MVKSDSSEKNDSSGGIVEVNRSGDGEVIVGGQGFRGRVFYRFIFVNDG